MPDYLHPISAAAWDPLDPFTTGSGGVVFPNSFSMIRGPGGFSAATCDLEECPVWEQTTSDDAYLGGDTDEYPEDDVLTTAARGQFSQWVFSSSNHRIGNNIDSRSSTELTALPPAANTVERPAKVDISPEIHVPPTQPTNRPAHIAPVQKTPRRTKKLPQPATCRFVMWEPKGSSKASSSLKGAVSFASHQISPSASSPGGSSVDESVFSSQYTGREDTYVFCLPPYETHLTFPLNQNVSPNVSVAVEHLP